MTKLEVMYQIRHCQEMEEFCDIESGYGDFEYNSKCSKHWYDKRMTVEKIAKEMGISEDEIERARRKGINEAISCFDED